MDLGTLLVLIAVCIYIRHLVQERAPALVSRVVGLFLLPQLPVPPAHKPNEPPVRSEAFTASEREVQGTNVQPEPVDFLPPTLVELRKLARAIEHNARGASKQASIELAFGVKKGGSAGWRRASQLFDEAMQKPAV
jgi:hypothetical protein